MAMPFCVAVAANPVIQSIQVRGNHQVEDGTIIERMPVRVGDTLSDRIVSQTIKELYKLGFFSDVKVFSEQGKSGISLFVDVQENPLVSKVDIKGNDEIEESDIKEKIKIKPGRIVHDVALIQSEENIRELYLKEGHYQVEISREIETQEDGRVKILFDIDEGPVTRIRQIRFVGNEIFEDELLRSKIASKASTLGAWFSDRDVFDRKRLQADVHLLEKYYRDHGHLDAQVNSLVVSLTPDKRWFYLTFNLYEGPEYSIGDIEIQGDIVPDKETLETALKLESGDIYSESKLRKSIEAMTEVVGDEGYAFANVTPLFERHTDRKIVDLSFDVEKGEKVYIRRIEIAGNTKSEDRVIRRLLRQSEGSRYSATRMKLGRTRMQRTDYFDDVRIRMPRTDEDDQVDVIIEVEEKRTGSLSIGGGFSQLEKAFFTTKVEDRNLFGKGLSANINADIGGKTQNFSIAVTDPYFLNKEMSASVSAFKTQTRLQDLTSFKQNNIGGSLGFGIPITEKFSYALTYKFDQTNIFDIPDTASLILRSQEGKQTTGELIQNVRWDSRDRVVTPSSGQYHEFRFSLAGVGGQNRFYEAQAKARVYFPLGAGFVLNPAIIGRIIRGYGGKEVPIYRRFSLGGIGSLRGFDNFGVTFRDAATGDVIGGNKSATASLNLFFPLPFMQQQGFRGVVFADAGTIANFGQTPVWNDVRASLGFGIEWMSPVLPLALVWGFPIRSQAGDRERSFEFALGTTF